MDKIFFSKIPSINTKAVCIAKNPEFAAIISSYFNIDDEYFCILESPRIFWDGNINEVIKINNIIALLKPEKIIFAGLDGEIIKEFSKMLPIKRMIIIQSFFEIESKLLRFINPNFLGKISCLIEELPEGLLISKIQKKKLVIDDSADSISDSFKLFPQSEHVVIIDDREQLTPIISVNYAFSINANISFIPTPPKEEVEASYEDIINSRTLNNTNRDKSSRQSIVNQQLKYDSYLVNKKIDAKFITFITKGIPYGYFYPETPSTHLFSYPDLGYCIFNGIFYEREFKITKSALILNPGFFKDSETEIVKKTLTTKGIYVKELKGTDATVHKTNKYVQWFTYDLLFICSHAGEVPGDLMRVRFNDRDGKTHEIFLEFVASLSLTDKGTGKDKIVDTSHFMSFVELDGVGWKDAAGKRNINASRTMEDFVKLDSAKWEIVSKIPIKSVRYCQAIKLTDDYYIATPDSIAGQENPIIFNNACVSFYELAERFIYAGARAYIGTLTTVDNVDAKAIAEYVFNNLSEIKTIPILLWEAQQKIYSDPEERVYIHIGCHFINIHGTNLNTKEYMQRNLYNFLVKLREKTSTKQLPSDVLRNIKDGIEFLEKVIQEL